MGLEPELPRSAGPRAWGHAALVPWSAPERVARVCVV